MSNWWFWWMIFVVFLLVTPLGYGWGYRGWGPPYPSYIQRSRELRAASRGGPGGFDHYAWGWGGDFVWIMLFIGMFWVGMSFLWPMWR